jgi:hypothetical protein
LIEMAAVYPYGLDHPVRRTYHAVPARSDYRSVAPICPLFSRPVWRHVQASIGLASYTRQRRYSLAYKISPILRESLLESSKL